MADSALQTLAFILEHQRFLTNRADQNVEQILGDHDGLILLSLQLGFSIVGWAMALRAGCALL